jgi:diguanylate cyclase (GGDEF)-like protein
VQWARVAGLGVAAAVPALLLAGWPDEVLAVPLVTAIVGLALVVGALARALLVLRRQQEAERVLAWQATHDPLTGLANRASLLDHLDRTRSRCRREGRECSVLFCDLDQFKVVNDAHGHGVGDELLIAVANRLRNAIHAEDALGRLGGDEFVVVAMSTPPERNGRADAASVVRQAMRTPFAVAGTELHVTISIGVVRHVQGSIEDAETIISDADIAMYRAKDNGRDRIEHFAPAMHDRMRERLSIENALRVALTNEEFFLVFQPVVSFVDGSIIAEEALLRWERPGHGVVMPGDFIGIAEATGLIADLGAWALRHGARRARQVEHRVAVNVSARQLRDPEMAQTAIEIVTSEGVAPASLVLEITETQLLEATETVRANLTALRRAGFSFSIDDFGLGYSNIGSLKQLDVETLKIDRSFVAGIGRGSGDETLIAAMITMAHSLGMHVIAEGVEQAAQLETLRALGCDAAQGYLLGVPTRPSPVEAADGSRRFRSRAR